MEQAQRERNIAVLDWFNAILIAFTVALLLLVFVFRTGRVEGNSMLPTLTDNDQVLARSIFYTPQRGDIVVVDGYIDYGAPIVKRVIGIAGDTIDIDFTSGAVYVNGVLQQENYISAPTTNAYDVVFPVQVPENCVFLMGDNRPHSKDSRDSEIGMISNHDILGKVVLRIFPTTKFGSVE